MVIYRYEKYFIYIDRTVPDKYRGKRCQFSWYIHKHGNKSADEKVIKLTPTYVSFTDTPAPMVPMTVDYFPLVIAGNGNEGAMTLSYYCDRLHRIYSVPNWSTFNPSIAPSGNSGIYRPEFTK